MPEQRRAQRARGIILSHIARGQLTDASPAFPFASHSGRSTGPGLGFSQTQAQDSGPRVSQSHWQGVRQTPSETNASRMNARTQRLMPRLNESTNMCWSRRGDTRERAEIVWIEGMRGRARAIDAES